MAGRPPINPGGKTSRMVTPMPDAMHASLAAVAEVRGTTKSQVVRDAVNEYIERHFPPKARLAG